MSGVNCRQLEKRTLLREARRQWRTWSLVDDSQMILATTALDSGLWVPGYELTINKWLVCAHGPSITVSDPAAGRFLLNLVIDGLDLFGNPVHYPVLTADASSGSSLHQCKQALTWVQKIRFINHGDLSHTTLTGGTIAIGHTQAVGAGNYIRYALPVRLKKAEHMRLLCVQNLSTGSGKRMTYDATNNVPATEAALAQDKFLVDIPNSTYFTNYQLDANGASRVTVVFDGRAGEL